eukprot:scaffold19909_cov130-Isochrysis_galbana.AAC.5
MAPRQGDPGRDWPQRAVEDFVALEHKNLSECRSVQRRGRFARDTIPPFFVVRMCNNACDGDDELCKI